MMKQRVLTVSLILLALGLCAAGIALGQPASVMAKAIRICLECIGIG